MQLFTLGIPVRICHGFCLHHNQNHINQNWILGFGLCLNYLVISRFVEMVTVTLGYNNNSEIMDHKVNVWPYDRIILLQFTFAKDKLALQLSLAFPYVKKFEVTVRIFTCGILFHISCLRKHDRQSFLVSEFPLRVSCVIWMIYVVSLR